MTSPDRSPDLLDAATSLLLLVDLQHRLMPGISQGEAVVARCGLLARGAALFAVPAAVTEQYPRGLGPTVAPLAGLFDGGRPATRHEKTRFSAAAATGWPPAPAREDGRFQVVLAGIETHICVAQTAFDLLALGYRVSVPADAVGSRRDLDHDAALARLRDAGAAVTTVEAVLFEWCADAAHPHFKPLRDLVTGR